jgi:hypothetical protein
MKQYVNSLPISKTLKNVLISNGVLTKEHILNADAIELNRCGVKCYEALERLKKELRDEN